MSIEDRIEQMGLTLPDLPEKLGTRRVRVVRAGDFVFLAGHGPFEDGGYPHKGPVGTSISVEDARAATRLNALALLATLKAEIGSLDRVARIVKLTAYVYGEPGFDQPSVVADGCSELLIDIFGDKGKHARSAVVVAGLTMSICCEIEMVVQIEAETL
jgi:enamine deaminase RidA (YjgF/YER057c/UK114 family)